MVNGLDTLLDAEGMRRAPVTFDTHIGDEFSRDEFNSIIMSLLATIPSRMGGVVVRVLSKPFRYYVHYVRNNEINRTSGKRLIVSLHSEHDCQFCSINRPTERYAVLCYAVSYRKYVLYSLSKAAISSLTKEVKKLLEKDSDLRNWLMCLEKYSISDKNGTIRSISKPEDIRYSTSVVRHSVMDNDKKRHADKLWDVLNLKDNIYVIDEGEEAYQELVANMIW